MCHTYIADAVIPARVLFKIGVRKFMPRKIRPSKPWRRRLDAVSLKFLHSYAKPWLKISSKERKCPSLSGEDIYLMCCSIHNSHMSTLWLNQNFCILPPKNVFDLSFKFYALLWHSLVHIHMLVKCWRWAVSARECGASALKH